jgi:hypothetical protein
MKTKQQIRRMRLISTLVAGVALVGFLTAVVVSLVDTNAPLTDNVGTSATMLDPAVADAVTAWNNQANIVYTATQALPVGESALSSASVDVTSDSFGYEVTIEWADGTYEQFTDITDGSGIGAGMGFVPDGNGMASDPSAFTSDAQISDQGMITLR